MFHVIVRHVYCWLYSLVLNILTPALVMICELFINRRVTDDYSRSKMFRIPFASWQTFDSLSRECGRDTARASTPHCLMARCHFQVFSFCYCYTFFNLIPFVSVLFALLSGIKVNNKVELNRSCRLFDYLFTGYCDVFCSLTFRI